MPCLNEEKTIATCIRKAINFLSANEIEGEVLIADNGSKDRSVEISKKLGARVIEISEKGYGNALYKGIQAAKGKYVIMGDSDDSYDFSKLIPFLEKLREGTDFVIGNRFKGGIEKGAMPFLNGYIGNPVLSFIGRLFFKIEVGDFHCGLRGFYRDKMLSIGLNTTGMEFASEMVVKSAIFNLTISEVPTTLSKDGRDRKPHLNPWRDGWRHLRFLLIFSPKWLFLYPGLLVLLFGLLLSITLAIAPFKLGHIILDIHSLLFSSSLVIIGFQLVTFFAFTKIYAVTHGLLPSSKRFNTIFKYLNLERGLIIGICIIFMGIFLTIKSFLIWYNADFKELIPQIVLRSAIPAVTFLILGFQIIIYSFFFSILGLESKNQKT